jgi:tRNA pseudouridine38-40 synthase
MFRYFMQLSYNGERYHGWQVQPNSMSVQEWVEKGLSVLTNSKKDVVGAGRTDSGVHASFYVAHFDSEQPVADTTYLANKLNAFLPNDIKIVKVFGVDASMHARFSALSRTYHYFLSTSKNPFLQNFAPVMHYDLDIKKMNNAANLLMQYSDFTSFAKLHSDTTNNLCNVTNACWSNRNGLFQFEVSANRFLRNMVRAIVGTLLDVGRGKITIDDFVSIIEAKDRCKAGTSVPPSGLFLSGIEYPESVNVLLDKDIDSLPFRI